MGGIPVRFEHELWGLLISNNITVTVLNDFLISYVSLPSAFLVMVRTGTAYRHLFQVT